MWPALSEVNHILTSIVYGNKILRTTVTRNTSGDNDPSGYCDQKYLRRDNDPSPYCDQKYLRR
jgi:hypothetical protein